MFQICCQVWMSLSLMAGMKRGGCSDLSRLPTLPTTSTALHSWWQSPGCRPTTRLEATRVHPGDPASACPCLFLYLAFSGHVLTLAPKAWVELRGPHFPSRQAGRLLAFCGVPSNTASPDVDSGGTRVPSCLFVFRRKGVYK